ncbi:MAG: hypothetical protein Q9203_002715 [Teloschistes exilis]
MHLELGDAWLHVTPFTRTVYLADALACQEVLVWEESTRQAREAVNTWSQQGLHGTYNTHENSMTLAFHVLANTGFGTDYAFSNIEDPPPPMHTMTWSKASNVVRENMLVAVAVPSRMLSLPFAPANWAKTGRAMTELRRYMEDILEKERRHLVQGLAGCGNLLSSLTRSSEGVKGFQASKSTDPPVKSSTLSTADILGDIYVFSLAGHETTGNALTFAIFLLAAHPEVQSWVQEEIDLAHKEGGWCSEPQYSLFPRFQRCLAVMLETLRLFPSVIAVPKYTHNEQTLNINGRLHAIPPKTTVILNITAIHTHPQYWGEDSLIWRPSRWIESNAGEKQASFTPRDETRVALLEKETLREPEPGTFFPWSSGSRVCPGMRYSKVEFVAVLSTLLRQHRVEPASLGGESKEAAQRRVLGRLADCRFAMTLYMADPNSVAMHWSLR